MVLNWRFLFHKYDTSVRDIFKVYFARLLYEMLEFTHVIFQINISYGILNSSNQQYKNNTTSVDEV